MILISPFGFLTMILVQVVFLFLFSLLFNIIKKIISKLYKISIRASDFFPIIMSYYIYQLSLDKHDQSFLPYVWLGLVIIGIIYAIYYLFTRSNAKVGIFYKFWWRFSIIYFFVVWPSTILIIAAKTL